MTVDAEPAHGPVRVDDAAADQRRRHQLRQSALAQAAHQLHLPEAVLGVHEAQSEGRVLDRAGQAQQHVVRGLGEGAPGMCLGRGSEVSAGTS